MPVPNQLILRPTLLARPWLGPIVAAVIILAAGGWGLLRPQWLRWQTMAVAAQAAQDSADDLAAYEQRLTSTLQKYQDTRRDAVRSVARLDTLLPATADSAALFAEFQEVVEQTGLVLVSLRISPGTSDSPRATLLQLSVTGGNYPALKRLLTVLERNLRLTDVINLGFDATVQSYTINAKVYSLQ